MTLYKNNEPGDSIPTGLFLSCLLLPTALSSLMHPSYFSALLTLYSFSQPREKDDEMTTAVEFFFGLNTPFLFFGLNDPV
jgi:hypothetical protein